MCRCLLSEHESGRLQTGQWISVTLAHIWVSGQEKSPVLPRGLSWLQPHLPLSLPCPVKTLFRGLCHSGNYMGNHVCPSLGGQVSQGWFPSPASSSFLTHSSSPGLRPPVQRKEHCSEGPDLCRASVSTAPDGLLRLCNKNIRPQALLTS